MDCGCGNTFTGEHTLSCPRGGFPTIRHNKIWDVTASLLTEVCHDVMIEPNLQPLTGEALTGATSNTANSNWGNGQMEHNLLQEAGLPPYWQMGTPLQLKPLLAKMPPLILPPEISHPCFSCGHASRSPLPIDLVSTPIIYGSSKWTKLCPRNKTCCVQNT